MSKIIGVSRVRNEGLIIKDVLDHLTGLVNGVVIYDDASTDDTLQIVKNHSLVIEVITNNEWEANRDKRKKAEGDHRQLLFDVAKKHSADWIYVFDADEFIEFDSKIELNDKSCDSYYFRLFDFYITPKDVETNYRQRSFIGPEFRDIPMMFRSNLSLNFHSRVPSGFSNIRFGGYVKHYGKATTVQEWDKKCNYYINHLVEKQPGNIDISDKWRKRLGRAVHTKSDFFNELITWQQKEVFGLQLTNNLEKLSTLKLKILVASNRLTTIGGSETFTYTLLEELNKYPNFEIEYFTLELGEMSTRIEQNLNVAFMSLNRYDLILANHNTTVDALKGKGFIIQTCHGIFPSLEQPSKYADGFVSISQEVQEHLANLGYSSKVIYNSINLNRFYPKKKLNEKPKTILSLCHSNEANTIIKNISEQLGLNYLEAYKYDKPIWNIEELINQSDIVFGLGRSAYESMSCGRPVIVFDKRSYFPSYGDGYVKNNLGFSIINNCSGRYSKRKLTCSELILEIKKYNAGDGKFFRDFALRELDVRNNVVKYIEYYLTLKDLEKNKRLDLKTLTLLKMIKKKRHRIIPKIKSKISLFFSFSNKQSK